MNELIQRLTGELDLTPAQAEGGVGMLIKMAQDHLGGGEADELRGAVPDAEAMERQAPGTGAAEGGVMGALGGLAGKLGGERAAAGAGLLGGLDKLGIDAATAAKFLPVVLGFLRDKGHGGLAEKLGGFLGR